MGIASVSCSLHAVSVLLHCLLGVCNLLVASCFDVFIVDGSRLLHCTLRQLNTGNLRCPHDGQSQFLLYPAQFSCAVPFLLKMGLASAAAFFSMSVLLLCCLACRESAFCCSPSVLSLMSSSCSLTFSQLWTAVYDMHVMVECCHELHLLPVCSPITMHMHPLSHPVAMHLSILLVC